MSEYKRFVSYIYEYPSHQKGPNRGFLKVECRNGICQMNFSLRGICRDDNGTAKIYGFRRENALLQGTLLSESEVTSGTLNLQVRFPEQEIGDRRYRIGELCGVILLTDDEQLCATQWDDDPLDFTGFPNAEPEKTQPVKPEPIKPEPIEPEPIEPEIAEPMPEEPKPEAPDPMKTEPEEIILEEPAKTEIMPEPEPVTSKTPETEPAKQDLQPEITVEEITDKEASPEPVPAASDIPEPELNATSRNTDADAAPARPWFRDGRITGCRQISQQDIRHLNPADWYLANNRFVIYGQQTFGHLLIGQLAENGQTVLCVPGIYHQQERALASMYGFTCFAPCPGHANRPQGFGYWYRLIQPADAHLGDECP